MRGAVIPTVPSLMRSGMPVGEAAILGLAVDLAHVDTQRAVPFDEVGRDRRRAGAGEAHPVHADGALDVVEHQVVGDAMRRFRAAEGRSPASSVFRDLEPDADRPAVGRSAQPGRLLRMAMLE